MQRQQGVQRGCGKRLTPRGAVERENCGAEAAGMGLGLKLGCLDTILQVVGSPSRGEGRGRWVVGGGGLQGGPEDLWGGRGGRTRLFPWYPS